MAGKGMIEQAIASLRAELVEVKRETAAGFARRHFPLVRDVFGVFRQYRDEWGWFVLYMQQVNRPEYRMPEGVALSAPTPVETHGKLLRPNIGILMALQAAGVITEVAMSGARCRMGFCSEPALSCLCDFGAWLEMYVYGAILDSGLADDVVMSAVLSWDDDDDDDDVLNEVDVIALKDGRLYLFSCKAGTVNPPALYELGALTRRFGGDGTKGILIAAGKRDDLGQMIRMRAEAMNILLLTEEDIDEAHIEQTLRSVFG